VPGQILTAQAVTSQQLWHCAGPLNASNMATFALLKKQVETLFRLICCERKILFGLKKQAKKYGLEEKRTVPNIYNIQSK